MDSIDVANNYQQIDVSARCQSIVNTVKNYSVGSTHIYCENCGCRIPDARLKAIPNAIRCVNCQAKYEESD